MKAEKHSPSTISAFRKMFSKHPDFTTIHLVCPIGFANISQAQREEKVSHHKLNMKMTRIEFIEFSLPQRCIKFGTELVQC